MALSGPCYLSQLSRMPYPEGDEEPPAPGTEDPSRPDGHWLPSLPQLAIDLILSHIEHNEIVCNVKLVGRGTHRLLFADARYRSVRMRSRIPQHALDAYWARPDAIKSYTLDQRHRMLCATAANGCVANMASLVKGCGCLLHTSMLAAAAASGHLPTCQWMREQGTDWDWTVLAAAARAGHLQVRVARRTGNVTQARPPPLTVPRLATFSRRPYSTASHTRNGIANAYQHLTDPHA